MKIHFSATDKIMVVIYLTPEAPVAVIAPVIPPKRDTREYSPGRAQAKAAPKGKYSEKTAVEDIQKNSASELCNNGACNCAALLFGKNTCRRDVSQKNHPKIFFVTSEL